MNPNEPVQNSNPQQTQPVPVSPLQGPQNQPVASPAQTPSSPQGAPAMQPIAAAPAAYTNPLGAKELKSLRNSGASAVAAGIFAIVVCLIAVGIALAKDVHSIRIINIIYTLVTVAFGILLISYGTQTKKFASTIPARALRALNIALITSIVYIVLSFFLQGIVLVTLLTIVLVIVQLVTRSRVKA